VTGAVDVHDRRAGAAGVAVRLELAPEPQLLGTLRLVVATAGRRYGLDEEAVQDLKVAVSEACAMSISVLRRAGLTTPVEVCMLERDDRLGVEVRDRAPGPRHAADGSGDLLPEHEFGLALVESLATEVRSGRDADGTYATTFWLDRS
jgi:anti-sigma regulatory factor (Ser/Thr protein kinase)